MVAKRELIRVSAATLATDSKSGYTTVTFGLLDGWWRHVDPEVRIPHSRSVSAIPRPVSWTAI